MQRWRVERLAALVAVGPLQRMGGCEPMLMLQVRLRAADGRQEALIAAVHRMAATTRGEAGCLRYDFYRDTEQPDGFLFVEEYRDEAALQAHLASAHFAEYRTATEGLVVWRQATRYEVSAATRH